MRLVGAIGSGWLADRIGRKTPLMISILWYSICNFFAGSAPTFALLFLFRTLLGIGMGAEWPAGAALAMESWPTRSRGFMSGVLQGSWGLGSLLSSARLRAALRQIGWRGLLLIGVLPALAIVCIRIYVKEPEVWVENRRMQREQKREFRAPLFDIFRRAPARQHADGVPVDGERLRHLLLGLRHVRHAPAEGSASERRDVALPIVLANLIGFLASGLWGWVADVFGRRWAMIIPA